MITEEQIPPACAFAVSILAERDIDPDAIPEEAIEAAQQHIATCPRCRGTLLAETPPTKKKKTRRSEATTTSASVTRTLEKGRDTAPASAAKQAPPANAASPNAIKEQEGEAAALASLASLADGIIDCQHYRSKLKAYAEAMDSGQNVHDLYPEVEEHLQVCESGCFVLLEIFRQDAKSTRKYRRRFVRNPLSIIGWEATGFFRGGQLPVSPKALSYGTLILLLLVAASSAYLGITWDNARYYHPTGILVPTPDGVGFSDGLRAYDACNANSYHDKREAASALQNGNFASAHSLLNAAISTTVNDTTGCNGAEAAIYLEDLQVRQSGRPYGTVIVSFDSGPGDANSHGGTDRHVLYAAATQELVGAFIAQQQYNTTQMQTPEAPLLYLVLANTTGVEQGALQIAQTVAALAHGDITAQQLGLFSTTPISATQPLLGILGLGPNTLIRAALPVMCRAGLPLIAPTATSLFILGLIVSTNLYKHCAPGFAFVRFSPDDDSQSATSANFAYNHLHVHNAAIFYDPSDPAAQGFAQGFATNFGKYSKTHIVAQETSVAGSIIDAHGRPQAAQDILLAGLQDALNVKPRPELIYTSLLADDVVTLAKAITRLPQGQQPILMIGGEYIMPSALQGVVQWARQQQLSLPRIYVSLASAARPPNESWQKQFYASFCTSFAAPGNYCSGAAALDQGALFFGDGIEVIAKAIGSISDASKFPTPLQMMQRISQEDFIGVSCHVALHVQNLVVIVGSQVPPIVVGIQADGSIQVMG